MSPSPSYVCAHDSRLPETVGAIVSDTPFFRTAVGRGAVYLPIDPALERAFPLGGFVKRHWGPSGWKFDLGRGEGGSTSALQVKAGVPYIHWAAEVVPRGPGSSGKLQLWVDAASTHTLNSGLPRVSSPDSFQLSGQSLILRGISRFNGTIDGLLGLGLWGVCRDVGVLWFAVSQAPTE